MKNNFQNYALIIFIFFLCQFKVNSANSLLNVNTENSIVYENILASSNSKELSAGIQSLSQKKPALYVDNYDHAKLNLDATDNQILCIKPINSLTAKIYYSQEEHSFIPGQSGLKLSKGANIFLFGDGHLSLGNHFTMCYELKKNFSKGNRKFELFRAYIKVIFYKFSIEGGIDNVNLGPGEYGLLLSNHAAPYPLIKLQTEDHLEFLGKWNLLIMQGLLWEDRKDHSNPRIIAIRINWKPANFMEFGLSRITMFGGENRPGYKLTEYPKLLIGSEENVPGSKYDNDSYAGYDLSLFIPLSKYFDSIKTTKLYYQEAATDIAAPWQEEDKGIYTIIFYERAFQLGLFLSTTNNIFRIEYVTTAKSFYSNGKYPVEGYTYKGLSLGCPYGRNIQSILVKHRYFFTNAFSLESMLGAYQQPAYEDMDKMSRPFKFHPLKYSTHVANRMKRYYISLQPNIKINNFILECYLRFDLTEKYNNEELANRYNIIDENRSFLTVGALISYRY